MGYGSEDRTQHRIHDMYNSMYSNLTLKESRRPCLIVLFNLCLTYNSFTVACSSLLVLAAEEQPVSLLLELLCGGTLLRAAGHLLHRLRGARLALLPYPVPRLFGWITDRLKMPCPSRTGQTR